jgi:hypothetical protein
MIVDTPNQQLCSSTELVGKGKKRVSFSQHSKLAVFEKFTYTHKSELWYSDSDKESFKLESAHMIHTIRSQGIEQLNSYDSIVYMGLEGHIFGSCTARNRKDVQMAVLHEQERQHKLNIGDPHRLALISGIASEVSRQRAELIGKIHSRVPMPMQLNR